MTPEEIKALMATLFAEFKTAFTADSTAAAKKVADDAAAKKVADDAAAKVVADAAAKKIADDAAAKNVPAGLTPELNTMILELRRANETSAAQVKVLTDQGIADKQRAEVAERSSVITAALSGFQFHTDAARATAVQLIDGQIKRTDAGQLVGGDNLTPEAFIKDFIPNQHPYLLAPVAAGGSGVTPGGPVGSRKATDLDSIKLGMSAEDRLAVMAAIQSAAPRA